MQRLSAGLGVACALNRPQLATAATAATLWVCSLGIDL